MAKITGLVIRPLFGKYVVCDGEGNDRFLSFRQTGDFLTYCRDVKAQPILMGHDLACL